MLMQSELCYVHFRNEEHYGNIEEEAQIPVLMVWAGFTIRVECSLNLEKQCKNWTWQRQNEKHEEKKLEK